MLKKTYLIMAFSVCMGYAWGKRSVRKEIRRRNFSARKHLAIYKPWLEKMQRGESIADFVGPLGVPTDYENFKKVAVIGGGVGCAIAYPQAKALYAAGVEVDVIVGFRNKDIVILEEEMKAVSSHYYLTTDDGSY